MNVNREDTRAAATKVYEGRYGDIVRRTVLPNGLRIITEAVPGVRSVSIGIYANVGSRDESVTQAGASHFLEHLLFKGTHSRSALEISAAIEAVGGDTNAYTTQEYTCYYARVLGRDIALAIDVLCDMTWSSVLTPAEVELERGVISEEIAMHDDEPADKVHEVSLAAALGEHPLGRPVIGSLDSIAAMPRNNIDDFYHSHYGPESIVIAAAGDLEHDHVVELVVKALNKAVEDYKLFQPSKLVVRQPPPQVAGIDGWKVEAKDSEQAHLVIGVPAFNRHDERKFVLAVTNQILGGGMSSRLFQEIREQRGLAYSVYSFTEYFNDYGLFGVYVGCAPERAAKVATLVKEELYKIAEHGLTAEELVRGKGMITGSMALGLEDTESRMERLGRTELLYSTYLSVDSELERIEAVTIGEIHQLAQQLFASPFIQAAVGPLNDQLTVVNKNIH